MKLKLLCFTIAILCISKFPSYSQTSVCELEKDRLCINYSYLRNKSIDLYHNDYDQEHRYNDDHIKIGIDYGVKDNIKISIIPSFRSRSTEKSDTPDISPSIGFQAMVSNNIPFIPLNYFGIASTRWQYSRLIDTAPKNLSIELIMGVGTYYKQKISNNISIVAFTDIYSELHELNILNIPLSSEHGIVFNEQILASQFMYKHIVGLELGIELNIWYDITLIAKYNYNLFSKTETDRGFLTLTMSIKKLK